MTIDLRREAFAYTILCQLHADANLPAIVPCEIDYTGVPDGLSRDVRAYLVGCAAVEAGEDTAVLIGFLAPEAHRDNLRSGDRIRLLRGATVIGNGSVIFACSRSMTDRLGS